MTVSTAKQISAPYEEEAQKKKGKFAMAMHHVTQIVKYTSNITKLHFDRHKW